MTLLIPISNKKQPITKFGDLYELNGHRLLCHNSLNPAAVEYLMNGQLADMSIVDPPYNVKIKSLGGGKSKNNSTIGNHEEFQMASGEMTQEQFIGFLQQIFNNLVAYSVSGSIHYIFMDWKHIYEISAAGRRSFTELKNVCIWNKDNAGMGTFYRSKHELVFVFKSGKAKHINNFELGQHGRYRTNVWDYAGVNSFKNKNRLEDIAAHPTVKPLNMFADAILDCSHPGQIILDLAVGSGTTINGAEKTDRFCYAMDISPKNCDTAVSRWIKMMKLREHIFSIKKNGQELSAEEIEKFIIKK
jgi:DNA modification methylase